MNYTWKPLAVRQNATHLHKHHTQLSAAAELFCIIVWGLVKVCVQ